MRGDGVGHARARRSPWPRRAARSARHGRAPCGRRHPRRARRRCGCRAARHGPRSAGCGRPAGRRCGRCRAPPGTARSRPRRLCSSALRSMVALPLMGSASRACRPRAAPSGRGAGPCRWRCAASRPRAGTSRSAGACSRRCGPGTMRAARPRSSAAPSRSTTTACTRSPHFCVRQADHGHVLDRRMRAEHGLDLGRVDVLAAGDDHVALAVDEVDVAVGVAAGHVADRAVVAAEGLARSSRAASSSRRRCRGCRSRARRPRRPAPRRRPRPAAGSGAEPTHSRPTEPSLVNCSSRMEHGDPARLGRAVELEQAGVRGTSPSPRAWCPAAPGPRRSSAWSRGSRSCRARTAAGRPSIMM